jgi:hypothetical protein
VVVPTTLAGVIIVLAGIFYVVAGIRSSPISLSVALLSLRGLTCPCHRREKGTPLKELMWDCGDDEDAGKGPGGRE